MFQYISFHSWQWTKYHFNEIFLHSMVVERGKKANFPIGFEIKIGAYRNAIVFLEPSSQKKIYCILFLKAKKMWNNGAL